MVSDEVASVLAALSGTFAAQGTEVVMPSLSRIALGSFPRWLDWQCGPLGRQPEFAPPPPCKAEDMA